MKKLSILLSLVSIPAFATELVAEHDGDALIAVPVTVQSSVTKDENDPGVRCTEVLAKLQRSKESILHCVDGSEVPENFCKLVKEDLTRTLVGRDASQGPSEQQWWVKASATQATQQEFAQFIDDNNAAPDQAILAKATEIKVSGVELVASEDSFSKLLSKASVLNLRPRYELDHQNQAPLIRTLDRLSACELDSGKLQVKTKVTVHYAYNIVKDQSERNLLWQLRGVLQAMKEKPYTHRQKYVLAGFHFADHLAEARRPATDAAVLSLGTLLLKETPEFALRDYRNEYHLGQSLPQVSKAFSKQLEAKGNLP